jgi:hypothetical protein
MAQVSEQRGRMKSAWEEIRIRAHADWDEDGARIADLIG